MFTISSRLMKQLTYGIRASVKILKLSDVLTSRFVQSTSEFPLQRGPNFCNEFQIFFDLDITAHLTKVDWVLKLTSIAPVFLLACP